MRSLPSADIDLILEHTGEVWRKLDGARIFLTGGTGFFGCWLVESFLWAVERTGIDATITVLTRSPKKFVEKAPHLALHHAVRVVEGDVRFFSLPQDRFTHVIHAAADATPALCREQPLLVLDTIVDGTRRVLDFAENAGARRVLFTSSGAVYGRQPATLSHIPEDYAGAPAPSHPEAVYAEGKRAAETLCAVYGRTHGLECVIARCFAFAGPLLPLDAHFAIGNFIRDAVAGGPIRIQGDGTAVRSYLYAADLTAWLWTMLVNGAPGRVYNVGSEEPYSIEEIARAVGGAVEIAQRPAPGSTPQRYVPSTQRARSELNLAQWTPLHEAIRRTAEWAAPPILNGDRA